MKPFCFLFILLSLITFNSYSQVVILEVSNPFPRVGDICEINYKIKSDTLEVSEIKSFKEQMKDIKNKELGSGTFQFTKLISDTGVNSFGPFTVNVNNKNFKSDIIYLHFDNPLPNQKRGIWIRQNSYLGQEYLIIEQRISGEWLTTNEGGNSISTEFKPDTEDFVEIDKEKINTKKMTFDFSFSKSHSQEVGTNDETETVTYKISLYKINKTGLFKDKLKLDKSNLKFLPEREKDFEFYVK
jgi:hypothetical protein